ncbi:MAG TPA: trypsin-like peptidase domain-containing protein [Candidatus Dormibacteraeota bacterium]|jgi:S1-C subfamily serine protease
MTRRLGLRLAPAVLLALWACSPLSPGVPTYSPLDIFEAAKPAVVMVETDNAVTWSVPQPSLTPQKEQQLRSAVVAMVRSGQVANNESAIGQASVRLLTDNPGSWFTAGGQRHQQTDSVLALGTGFFVTENGYLLTNNHVVETSADDIKQQLLDQLQRAGGDPKELATFRDETSRGLGVSITDVQASRLFTWMLGVFKSDLRVTGIERTYRIGFGTVSPADVQSKGTAVQLVSHGQSTPGRDVAVLKAPGGPFVSLAGAPGMPGRGAGLAVIGYPCKCGDGSTFDATQPLRPVLTSGTAREEVAMQGGWYALGTDAPIEHGNSGGPVLDDTGRVVGLATFSDAAAEGAPRSFAVPMAVAVPFVRDVHVQPAQGALGQTYGQAVVEYRQQHFRAALPLFQQVARADPTDPYAKQYLAQTQRAIAAGRDQTPPLAGALPVLAVGVYVLVSVAAVVIGVVVYRRRRRLVHGY